MSKRLSGTATATVALLALSLALSACGRRGPLEPPPGAAGQPASRNAASGAVETRATSTFAGSPTIRPMRETETTDTDTNANPNVPETPQIQTPQSAAVPVPVGPQTISAGQAGLRTTTPSPRRSPPPNVPFILDPLL